MPITKRSNKTVKSVIELDEMVKNPELEMETFKKSFLSKLL